MIVLIGESGSGKTATEKVLAKRGFKIAISHTTRKPRVGEVEGVAYFFTTLEEMDAMEARGELAERIPYNGNEYALCKDQCLNDRVVTVEPKGLLQLQAKKDLDLFVIYLSATEETRRKRMTGRGDAPESVEDRIVKDRVFFKGIGDKADRIIDTNDLTLEQVANRVIELYSEK